MVYKPVHTDNFTQYFDLAACTQAQREVDERVNKMKVAQLQIEKLQCSMSYEQERCFTLDLELSTTRAELQKKKEQSGRLEMELQQLKVAHQEVVSGLKSLISNFFPHIYIYMSMCMYIMVLQPLYLQSLHLHTFCIQLL